MPSKYLAAAAFVILCAACGGDAGAGTPMDMASDPAVADGSMAPMFEVDPLWPKPLPNHWLLGSTIGVAVDSREHVWIIHRTETLANNEIPAALDPPSHRGVLLRCTARCRVRCRRQSGRGLGRSGSRIRLADCRITALSSTTWTTFGSAGMVLETRTS